MSNFESDIKEISAETIQKSLRKNEKMALRKGSVQFPVSVWEYLDKKSINGVVSVAAIVRSYTLNGIRQTIATDFKKITIRNLLNTNNGFFAEFKEILVQKKFLELSEENGNNILYENTPIFLRAKITNIEVLDYFTKNPEAFEKAKNETMVNFLSINDEELLNVISSYDY